MREIFIAPSRRLEVYTSPCLCDSLDWDVITGWSGWMEDGAGIAACLGTVLEDRPSIELLPLFVCNTDSDVTVHQAKAGRAAAAQ